MPTSEINYDHTLKSVFFHAYLIFKPVVTSLGTQSENDDLIIFHCESE